MVNGINAKFKFSSNYRVGSPKMRQELAEVINNRIFMHLLNMYKRTDSVKIKELRLAYNKLIPDRKRIKISGRKPRFFDDCSGFLSVITNKKNKMSSYSIELASKDFKLPVYDLVTLMHESLHYLDCLLNPKYIRSEENFAKNKANNTVEFLYNEFYYTQNKKNVLDNFFVLKKIKYKTEKTLSGLSNKEKIDILNYLRYSLMLEKHAYSEVIKYTDTLMKSGREYYTHDEKMVKSFMFDDKIKLLEKMLAKVIKEERKNIRSNVEHS